MRTNLGGADLTARDGAVLAYRSLGLWFVGQAAYHAAGLIPFFDAAVVWHRTLYSFFPSAAHLVAGYLLWRCAHRLAAATFSQNGEATASPSIDADRLLAVAFSTLGAWCVVDAGPSLVSGLVTLWSFAPKVSPSSSSDSDGAAWRLLQWTMNTKTWTLAAAVRLAIGLGLLAGPTRLARAVRRVRTELRGSLHEDPPTIPADTDEPAGGA